MQINFPERGEVLSSSEDGKRHRFISAPLDATFWLNPKEPVYLGQGHSIVDDFGTILTYRLNAVYAGADERQRGTGVLIGIARSLEDMVPAAEHYEKVSSAIDHAFEAGRQVGQQEAAEAEPDPFERFDEPQDVYIRFADNSFINYSGIVGVAEDAGVLTLARADGVVGVHPSWRGYEISGQAADTASVEAPAVTLAEYAAQPSPTYDELPMTVCDCVGCKMEKKPPEERSPYGKFYDDLMAAALWEPGDPARIFPYGPVGGKA